MPGDTRPGFSRHLSPLGLDPNVYNERTNWMTIFNLCFWSAKPFLPNQTKILSRVLKYKTEYKANLIWLEKEKPKGGCVQ